MFEMKFLIYIFLHFMMVVAFVMVYHYLPLQTNFCSKQMIDQNFAAEPGKKMVALHKLTDESFF